MRRPIVFIAAAFAAGIGVEFFIQLKTVVILSLLAGSAVFFFWAVLCEKKNGMAGLFSLFFAVFLLGGMWFSLAAGREDFLLKYEGRDVTVVGRVTGAEKKDADYYRLTLETEGALEDESGEGRKGKSRLLISVYGDLSPVASETGDKLLNHSDLIGRRVSVSGGLQRPQDRRNPRCFDYRLYLKTNQINLIMAAEADSLALLSGDVEVVSNRLAVARQHFSDKLYTVMSPEMAGLVTGMMFGDKNGLDEELYESFQRNGTAHILSVSGLHVGIVYACINKLARGRQSLLFDCFAAGLLLCYAAMASFSPSVVRASAMILLHIFARRLYFRYDMLSAAAATGLTALAANPFMLFHAGFLLSYLAIFSLALLMPFFSGRAAGFLGPVLAIQVGMIPVTAYLFNYFSLGAFVANIPVIFLSGILIPLGMILFLISFLPGGLGTFVYGIGATATELIAKAMVLCNDMVYMGGKTSFHTVSPGIFFLCLYYGGIILLCSEWGRILRLRRQIKKLAAALLVLLIIGIAFHGAIAQEFDRAQMVFLDVGQGDCLHIKTPEGRNILIDGGGSVNYDVGKKTLMPYLLKNGVKKIDMAIVTHLHMDHYGGIASLARNMEVEKLGVYEGNQVIEEQILEETSLESRDIAYLVEGQRIELGEGIWVEILYPQRQTEEEYRVLVADDADENASSLIMKVHYQGISVLMTGDIDMEGEKRLMALYEGSDKLNTDLLKVGHHGSRYSTGDEFLEIVGPSGAVFQVGKNNFGHPHETILRKCQERGIPIWRNDTQGAVGVFIKEDGSGELKGYLDEMPSAF